MELEHCLSNACVKRAKQCQMKQLKSIRCDLVVTWGLQDAVSSGGPLLAVIGFCVLPLLWSVPEALITAELATTFPENSGYVAWVTAAFGPFWGFQVPLLMASSFLLRCLVLLLLLMIVASGMTCMPCMPQLLVHNCSISATIEASGHVP